MKIEESGSSPDLPGQVQERPAVPPRRSAGAVLVLAVLVLAMMTVACGGETESTEPAQGQTSGESTHQEAPAQGLTGVALGESLSTRLGCIACHSVDGSALVGPSWKGLYGKQETLADGSTVAVDDTYLRESIVEPDAKIVNGFPAGTMPPELTQNLSEQDTEAIIEYIKTLK
ncbi:MAG: hypothetical protein CL878_04930 [Dehalococcoidia bacterium]|nr:hypothetical protein [Dehalococcoidia bacterium]